MGDQDMNVPYQPVLKLDPEGRRSGDDRRHGEEPSVQHDRRSGDERRSDDRRGPHQNVKPGRVLDFRALIEDWLDKNCEGDWRIGTNPRDDSDETLRIHFDNPRDKARFNTAMRALAQKITRP